MDLDAFRWLLTDDGQRLLGEALTAVEAGEDALATQTRLRRTAAPGQVAAALTQATLRVRARDKFGDVADRMYFTPDGLEQATRPRSPSTGRPDWSPPRLGPWSTWAAASAATCWRPPAPGWPARASTSTRSAWRSPRPTSPRWGSRAP